ncbi:MAG: matrixin family metalloprotease [Phenylobacterium sp.]|uniref:matrixin family metalloprotease n=1 Tax=Phenylobacterium sp. TaxID=1871053 RepID=UPI001A4D3984|nr:matrixin family metalloprotease [Phenylobacterium sp.]MBL8554638.1 matrixin family metalloprotease [Phenylobacterium sp.]
MPVVTTFESVLSGLSWNGIGVAGRPAFVSYSFDTSPNPGYALVYSGAFLGSFQALTAPEQDVARQALKAWGDASGLTFLEVPAGQGDIRFGIYDFRFGPESIEDSLAFAFNPFVFNFPDGAFEDDFGGDIFIDLGQATFDTLVHEIGHAIGLKHPFEEQPTLDPTLDDLAHTVMTYNPAGGPATALGSLDILAAQYLYGPASADGTQAASWSWDSARLLLSQSGGIGADTLAGIAVADRIAAGAGDDYVMSRGGADQLDGGDGADTMAGGDGADTLLGAAGNDVLDGDPGDDSLMGGEGDDDLWGMEGADVLDGEGGSDTLSGGSGVNRLSGGPGNDVIVVVDGRSIVDGGDGYDELWLSPLSSASAVLSYASLTAGGGSFTGIEAVVMFGDANADTLQGGAMPDVLVGAAGADSLSGGASDDELFGDTGADTLSGGEGSDYLEGWSGDDWLIPGGGNDIIWGASGVDTVDFSGELEGVDVTINANRSVGGAIEQMFDVENIVGTPYSDNIIGDANGNRLFGGGGADTVNGRDGANYLRGDDGNDSIVGGAGFDDINGNVGDDTGSGGLGDDWVVGGKDQDRLSGDEGNDLVYGNLGADTCEGGSGNDTIRGGQQDDVLVGGAGDDYVSGDKDNDTVTGGEGADIFHTFGDAGIDRVTDFSIAQGDRVMLDPGTQYTVSQVGADTVIAMNGGGQMILVGVAMSSLTGNWIFGA